MAEPRRHLSHLLVQDRSTDADFRRPGGGNPKIRPVEDRAGHGARRIGELETALAASGPPHEELLAEDELHALGTVITLEGEGAAYPLKLDSLQQLTAHRRSSKQPKWLLLSVLPGDPAAGLPERAAVWVSDQYRSGFLRLFEDYLFRSGPKGNPKNNELVANIARIRAIVLNDLWQSEGQPPKSVSAWWEIWLRPTDDGPDLLRRFATAQNLEVSPRVVRLFDRTVTWVKGNWAQLEILPFTAVPIAEIRAPGFIDTIEDFTIEEQGNFVNDLAERVSPAADDAPAVCHLDTGVARTHLLLEGSLAPDDLHTVVGASGFDRDGHGTKMAGVALLGDLDQHLTGSHHVALRHRLESVRILPTPAEGALDPVTYGDITAQAVSLPEITSARRRVYCMPVSTNGDTPNNPGQPTLWSATVDALAVGASVVRNGHELQLLAPPDPEAARLLVVSAGNVDMFVTAHLDESDSSAVRDPGQAWNALTVGAHTELTTAPSDPAHAGWTALAPAGELSPHSRTSLLYGTRPWPIKPDIVMEGGNVLHDGRSLFEPSHPLVSLRTTGHVNNQALTSANATSIATAQAARLGALAMATYPAYWPETIRGLLVHGAVWTPAMHAAIKQARQSGLEAQQRMLRRYGWGQPSEDRVLYSGDQAVTLVVQDEFVPFAGDEFKIPAFRLHDLPWPTDVLEDLDATPITLRATLSYFIEPTASRRGWRQRYSYASHALRFELQDPLESESDFVKRINRDARTEESGGRPTTSQVNWLIGANQRNLGSLHQDEWASDGITLSRSGRLAIYPVGGWWKNNRAQARIDQPVRYSLIVSLKTDEQDVDLYTPIANLLKIPTAIETS